MKVNRLLALLMAALLALLPCAALAEEADVEAVPVEAEVAEIAVEVGGSHEAEGAGEGVAIDEAHFPDAIFRGVIAETFDTDRDGALSDAEIAAVTSMDVGARGITSLKGLEHFTALGYLQCSGDKVKELDVSKNTALWGLDCWDTELTSLDVSNNKELVLLNCESTPLTELKLGNAKLNQLSVQHSALKVLDVSECARLVKAVSNKWYSDPIEDEKGYWAFFGDFYNGPCICYTPGLKIITKNVALKKNASSSIHLGGTVQINLVGKTAKSWKTSDKHVATVDKDGFVTTHNAGKCKITVTDTKKKKIMLTLSVVDPYAPTKVTIDQGKKLTLKAGETAQLSAKLSPNTAISETTWKSSKKSVASVDKNGLVMAKKKGTAKITVQTENGKKATITITVKK